MFKEYDNSPSYMLCTVFNAKCLLYKLSPFIFMPMKYILLLSPFHRWGTKPKEYVKYLLLHNKLPQN